jgi:uncharacterized protein (UPF0335 family)
MTTLHQSTQDQLKTIVARIEKLEEEKSALSEDIKNVYAEAKSNGFDVKALRAIIRIRKQDDDKRTEEETILATGHAPAVCCGQRGKESRVKTIWKFKLKIGEDTMLCLPKGAKVLSIAENSRMCTCGLW